MSENFLKKFEFRTIYGNLPGWKFKVSRIFHVRDRKDISLIDLEIFFSLFSHNILGVDFKVPGKPYYALGCAARVAKRRELRKTFWRDFAHLFFHFFKRGRMKLYTEMKKNFFAEKERRRAKGRLYRNGFIHKRLRKEISVSQSTYQLILLAENTNFLLLYIFNQ